MMGVGVKQKAIEEIGDIKKGTMTKMNNHAAAGNWAGNLA